MSEMIQKAKFSFTIKQPDLNQTLKAISTIVDEATFNVNPEGITFRGMDPSHVALVDIALPNCMFEKYEAEIESKFAVRIDELALLVKQFDKTDSINMTTNANNELILSHKEFTYKMKLIEASATDCPLPKIPYDAKTKLYGKTLLKILNKIKVVGDYVTFSNDGINFRLAGKGDKGELDVHLEKGMDDIIEISSRDSTQLGTYSLEYIIPYLKQFATDVVQTVEYSTSKPLRIDSKINNIARMQFYLAPRIES